LFDCKKFIVYIEDFSNSDVQFDNLLTALMTQRNICTPTMCLFFEWQQKFKNMFPEKSIKAV
jgi:hypothetical protein